jgi:hypothetical protein
MFGSRFPSSIKLEVLLLAKFLNIRARLLKKSKSTLSLTLALNIP